MGFPSHLTYGKLPANFYLIYEGSQSRLVYCNASQKETVRVFSEKEPASNIINSANSHLIRREQSAQSAGA